MEIVPCGAIANSMFNGKLFNLYTNSKIIIDTFILYYMSNPGTQEIIPWTHKGVVWSVDKNQKFRNPGLANSDDCSSQTLAELQEKFQVILFQKNDNFRLILNRLIGQRIFGSWIMQHQILAIMDFSIRILLYG